MLLFIFTFHVTNPAVDHRDRSEGGDEYVVLLTEQTETEAESEERRGEVHAVGACSSLLVKFYISVNVRTITGLFADLYFPIFIPNIV